MVILLVDTKKRRDVVVEAYLNADMDDFILLKSTGGAVNIMCYIVAKYVDYVTTERSGKVLYTVLSKDLYGCVMSALLWYDIFLTTLMDLGFSLNSYDPCVANEVINGSQ
jgi:hypothetical protein